MQGYTYKYGDRPLAGYTIQRAAGRGGFGEVYYALSDSGREVALKAVQGFEDIELRGISQCMNLKSPHLVTIFDVRHNDQDKPFVIMEYVNGPSLRDLIDESPSGLGTQKAAFFLREMGKGLTYLHDRGIVHRDLKPGNVFYEDGYVKIGDYGLSKAISASKHSGQTITVGTVHYMAPEIGEGRYDRSIDIYALGCMLYEMLTGQTPYLGNSPGEILMKHLMAEPNVASIEEPFAGVIRKAMAKDPKDRYQTVQEMIEAVFGAAHIQQSVSCFSPDSLTMVAGRVARKVTAGGPGSSGQIGLGDPQAGQGSDSAVEDRGNRVSRNLDRIGQRIGEIGERIGGTAGEVGRRIGDELQRAGRRVEERVRGQVEELPPQQLPIAPTVAVDAKRDPMSNTQRSVLCVAAAILVATGAGGMSSQGWGSHFLVASFGAYLFILGAAGGLFLAEWMGPALRHEPGVVRRLAYGGLSWATGTIVSSFALLCSTLGTSTAGPLMSDRYFGPTLLAIAVPLFLMEWWAITDVARPERISLGHALGAGIFGAILSGIFGGNVPMAAGILAGISLVVQVRQAWDPLAVRPSKKEAKAQAVFRLQHPNRIERWQQRRQERWEARQERRQAAAPAWPTTHAGESARPMPAYARIIFSSAGIALLAGGIGSLCGALGEIGDLDDFTLFLVLGVLSLMVSIFLLRLVGRGVSVHWWSGFVIPLLRRLCAGSIVASSITLGSMGWSLSHDALMAAIFFIIFPAILMKVLKSLSGVFGPRADLPPAVSHPSLPPQGSGDAQDHVPAVPVQSSQDAPMGAQSGGRSSGWQGEASSSQRPARYDRTNPFLALLGGLLMIVSLGTSLAGTLIMPAFAFAGVFDPSLANTSWYGSFMDGSWEEILGPVQIGLSTALMLLAVIVLMMARRRAGGAHMIRAVFGPAGMLASLQALHFALNFDGIDWPKTASFMQHGYIREGLGDILRQAHTGGMIAAGLLMLASTLVLAWPPRRHDDLPAVGKGV